jgi:hypothetical protein
MRNRPAPFRKPGPQLLDVTVDIEPGMEGISS